LKPTLQEASVRLQPLEALISKASQGFNDMGLLEKLKLKRVGAKNPVFVEAGRRGGIRSGEIRRARAEQRRLMEEGISPTELAEKVAALLETPKEPGPMEPIEVTASPASMEAIHGEEMEEEGGALEPPAPSRLERALEETEAELSDIRRLLPSQQHVEKAMEELEYVKHMFEVPCTLSILEELSKRGAGKVENPEDIDQGNEASRKGASDLTEEVKRILG